VALIQGLSGVDADRVRLLRQAAETREMRRMRRKLVTASRHTADPDAVLQPEKQELLPPKP